MAASARTFEKSRSPSSAGIQRTSTHEQLAKVTDGLTGSEIKAVFIEALYQSFDDDKEPTDLTIAKVLTEFVPLSKTMAEQITGLRNWAKGRARFAKTPAAEPRLRRLAA